MSGHANHDRSGSSWNFGRIVKYALISAAIVLLVWAVWSGRILAGNGISQEDLNRAVSSAMEPLQTQQAAGQVAPQVTEPATLPTVQVEEADESTSTSKTTKTNNGGTNIVRCNAGDEYYLDGLTSLDNTDVFLHVQYWLPDGSGLQYETILEPGSEWIVDTQNGGGYVWEYPSSSCTFDQVRQQATLSINRTPSDKAGGFVDWDNTDGVFTKN